MSESMSIEASIGEILRLADEPSDNNSKEIISAYKQDVNHNTNVANISSSKIKLEKLENCATFLNIAIINQTTNKKIFSNKSLLADRIVLRIESLFPQKCKECEQDYCCSLDSDILFECFLCTQLSHNCESIKIKYAAMKNENLPLGMVWLCHGCHEKNNHFQQVISKRVVTSPSPPPPLAESSAPLPPPSSSPPPPLTESSPPPTAQVIDRTTAPLKICPEYIYGKCKHGINGNKMVEGQKCKFSHPKRCIKYCKFGSSSHLGCNFGSSCRWFHPILCKYSVMYGNCSNQNCTYVHLTNTQRQNHRQSYPPRQQNQTSRTKTDTRSNYYYASEKQPQSSQGQYHYQSYKGSNRKENHYPTHYQNNLNIYGKAPQEEYEYEYYEPLPQEEARDNSTQSEHFLEILKEFKSLASEMKQIRQEWRQTNLTTIQHQFKYPTPIKQIFSTAQTPVILPLSNPLSHTQTLFGPARIQPNYRCSKTKTLHNDVVKYPRDEPW